MAFFKNLQERLLQTLRTTYRTSTEEGSQNAIYAFLQIVYDLSQKISDAAEEYATDYYPLDVAPAWILDPHWGPSLDVPRNGLSDADFRLYCQAQKLLITSAGTHDGVLQIMRLLLPPAAVLEFDEYFPKAWTVTITGIPLADALPVVNFLRRNPKVGGVYKTPTKGYATAGEKGAALVADDEVLTFDSVSVGPLPILGNFDSQSVVIPGVETAGYALTAEL